MKSALLVIACLSVITGCSGPSKEELRRMQMLEAQRTEQADLNEQREAAERKVRVEARRNSADQAWQQQIHLSPQNIDALFSVSADNYFASNKTFFTQFELQAAKYNYSQKKQSFTIIGMRNFPDSTIYGPLFPDNSATYQAGHQPPSVLEFALREETEENRLGQQVLRPRGQRWVAATLNFKNYKLLTADNNHWYWEAGLFEDISWTAAPELVYPYTSARSLVLQLGMRFCTLERCYLQSEFRKHPTQAVRAEVISALVADKKSGKVLATFIRKRE